MVKQILILALNAFAANSLAADAPAGGDLPPLPQAVSSFGAAVHDGCVYVYGGHCAKTHNYSTESVLGTFHRLRLSAPGKWETLPGGAPCQGLALVAHGGKIYRIGGMQPRNALGEKADNHSLTSCSRFDPITGQWESLPDLPGGRSSHDAVVVGDQLVVVGGWKLSGAGKTSEWYDTTLILDLNKPARWETVQQPFRRRALIATVHKDKVYVIGGMNEDSKTELTVNVFDPQAKTWTTGPDIPSPRRNGFSPAACSDGNSLFVNPSDGRVLSLSLKGTWTEVGQVKQPRIVHRMVPAGNRLVVLGGASGGDNVALTETVTPRIKP